jgi:spore maturation protein CgeB
MYNSVLFIGDLSDKWTRSHARLDAIRRQVPNGEVKAVNWNRSDFFGRFLLKVYFKLNLRILAPFYFIPIFGLKGVELVWIDNFPLFPPGFLPTFKKFFKNTTVILVSEDNFLLAHNHANLHRSALPFYDHVFTTKRYVMEKRTGNMVLSRISDSFDDRLLDKKATQDDCYEYDVSFIGTFERSRFEYLKRLSEHGIKVDVFGNGWPREKKFVNLSFHPAVYGPDYRTIALRSKISLLFLRHQNFDDVTSRSFEIPAFGAFFLAEKSIAHKQLYESQDILFADHSELLRKVRYWLAEDPTARFFVASQFSSTIGIPQNSISAQVTKILTISWKSQ